MQKVCYPKVDLPNLTTMIQEDGMSAPIIHEKWASGMIMMKYTLEDLIL